jgi:hypothetical protein
VQVAEREGLDLQKKRLAQIPVIRRFDPAREDIVADGE